MTPSIAHSRPALTAADRDAVGAVLETGMLERGARVAAVERWFRDAYGAVDAVATGSGTQALLLALRSLGIAPGDEVVMPTYVCPEVMDPVQFLGARPVLVDVADDYLAAPDAVARACGSRTAAIVFPYLFGIHRPVDELRVLGVPVIEDCAHFLVPGAPGFDIAGDLAFFSFKATKLAAAGEGGLVLSRSAPRAAALREAAASALAGQVCGLYAISDLSAALLLEQLARLDEHLALRRRVADRYLAAIDDLGQLVVADAARRAPAPFRLPLRLADRAAAERFIACLGTAGISARRPVEPLCHHVLGGQGFARADALHAVTVSLPLYPALTEADVAAVVAALRGCCAGHAS